MIDEPYINLLAEKAQAKVQSRENGTYDTRKFNLEFARLIIDICIDLVEDGVDHREPASTYGDKIRDHFGIDATETADSTLRNRSTYFGNNP
jgi:hypothetical protein